MPKAFTYTARDTNGDGLRKSFVLNADSTNPASLHYFVDEYGPIRWEKGRPASASSPALE